MMTYSIVQTKAFRKGLTAMKRRGCDISKLNEVVGMLAMGQRLPPIYRDHPLKNNHKGERDCHITPDWLLVYRKNEHTIELILLDTGTHRELGLGG